VRSVAVPLDVPLRDVGRIQRLHPWMNKLVGQLSDEQQRDLRACCPGPEEMFVLESAETGEDRGPEGIESAVVIVVVHHLVEVLAEDAIYFAEVVAGLVREESPVAIGPPHS